VTTRALRPALVLLGAYVSLTAAAYSFGEGYLAPWMPWFRLESDWLLPDGFSAAGIELATNRGERLIVLRAVSTAPLTLAQGVLSAGEKLRSTTLQAYALHHAVIVFAVLAAWPVATWRRRLALLALGVPCVVVTTSLDIPFVLAGLTRELLLDNGAPGGLAGDALVLYYALMHGGGRYGLAIAGALSLVAAARGKAPGPSPPGGHAG
jgi:hypothetical protein